MTGTRINTWRGLHSFGLLQYAVHPSRKLVVWCCSQFSKQNMLFIHSNAVSTVEMNPKWFSFPTILTYICQLPGFTSNQCDHLIWVFVGVYELVVIFHNFIRVLTLTVPGFSSHVTARGRGVQRLPPTNSKTSNGRTLKFGRVLLMTNLSGQITFGFDD